MAYLSGMLRGLRLAFFCFASCLGAGGCQALGDSPSGRSAGVGNSLDGNATGGAPTGVSEDANSPPLNDARPTAASYVRKVKAAVCGAAATSAEIEAVAADANALGSLVDGWMATPAYKDRLQDFFGLVFQQADVSISELNLLPSTPSAPYFNGLASQFAKRQYSATVQAFLDAKQPLTATMTGRQLMMNPFLATLTMYVDQGADFRAQNPQLKLTFTTRAIDPQTSIDPNSPDYMHWTVPSLDSVQWSDPVCKANPLVIDANNVIRHQQTYVASTLFYYIQGVAPSFYAWKADQTRVTCSARSGWPTVSFGPGDANVWRMVQMRTPKPGEQATKFYDTAAMMGAKELVMSTPRTGFMDTIAFQSRFPTNTSNQYRAAMNQAMVVALGQTFNGGDQTVPLSLSALDQDHAGPQTDCYSCHVTLDPMRQFFRQTWDVQENPQKDPNMLAMPGQWAWDGLAMAGNGTLALGTKFAESPRFAASWTQKLCTYLRSGPCLASDPEFIRIAALFADSGYQFNPLMKALATSPLTTFATSTATEAASGQVFAMAKQGQLCQLLSTRLGLDDVCGLGSGKVVPKSLQTVAAVATIMPVDGYTRGSAVPYQANDPALPLLAGLENVCKALADVVVDGTTPTYSSTDADAAIASMVHGLMNVDADRDQVPRDILKQHYVAAVGAGASPTVALRSAFVLGCNSPLTLTTGLTP